MARKFSDLSPLYTSSLAWVWDESNRFDVGKKRVHAKNHFITSIYAFPCFAINVVMWIYWNYGNKLIGYIFSLSYLFIFITRISLRIFYFPNHLIWILLSYIAISRILWIRLLIGFILFLLNFFIGCFKFYMNSYSAMHKSFSFSTLRCAIIV